MASYILALDQGTTSSRAIVFDRAGQIAAKAQYPFPQIYPQAGWVEHDPMTIWDTERLAAAEAIRGLPEGSIAGIGVTNQRETTIVWDKATGQPVYNAIVWQCRRTAELCEELKRQGLEERIVSTTGLLIDAYFSGTKIRWILDHVEGAQARAEKGEILFGTVDSWLLWNLTGGKVHASDYSNCCRTMLFDIHRRCWDETLCQLLDVPMGWLPQPVENSGDLGTIASGVPHLQDLAGLPIRGAAGDQQAALFGQGCFQAGQLKNTYGTGCFTLMNVGAEPVRSRAGLVSSVAWSVGGRTTYALEGSVFNGGSTIQWLRDELHLLEDARDSEYMAQKVRDTNGCYVVPAFTGLGAPHWDQYARGTIVGLTRGVNKNHIIRATLDSLCYQINDVLAAMQADSGIDLTALKVDGGACANNYLLQTMADISNLPVKRPCCVETTALGAAYLAGLAVGYWSSTEDVLQNWSVDREFMPGIPDDERTRRLKGWNKAVRCSYGWAKED